jgi:dihydroorotate dehydrogenase (fumarate)
MADLKTRYLGFDLKNPLVASASPLSEKVESVQQLEAAGISAVVMYSLFEEQVIHESLELDHFLFSGTEISPEFNTFYPQSGKYTLKPEMYIENLGKLKRAVKIPVIGSLNGVSTGGWIKYAKKMEDAGADAIELNLYYLSTSPEMNAQKVEDTQATLVNDVCRSVKIPVAVKLSPFYTSLPHLAKRLVEAGAKGLVLFNRFYQPDIDLETLDVVPALTLSSSAELRLPLRWIAILHGQIKADLALTTGIHTAEDVLKAMFAGASVSMLASSLLKHSPAHATKLLADLQTWLTDHEYTSIQQLQGAMGQKQVDDPAAYERANYMKVLSSLNPLP